MGVIYKMARNDMALDSNLETTMHGSTSQQSLLSVMNRFVQAVSSMEETVLMPSRLRDIPVSNDTEARSSSSHELVVPTNRRRHRKSSPAVQKPKDLYTCYMMLNAVKSELVEGPRSEDDEDGAVEVKPRAGSNASNDEGISSEDEEKNNNSNAADNDTDKQSKKIAKMFRHHLTGLFDVLDELTNSADFLKGRYEEELVGVLSTSPKFY